MAFAKSLKLVRFGVVDIRSLVQQRPISQSVQLLASPNWSGFRETVTILPSGTVSICTPNT
jgi:hypothetical protein